VTHKFSTYFILAIGALGLSALPAFATESCTSGDVPVVAPPADPNPPTTPLVCSMGALTFSWESLSFNPVGGNLEIVTPWSGIYGDDYSLEFQFSGVNETDVLMTYEVSSTSDDITQVDSQFTPVGGTAPANITESVCSVDPAANAGMCPNGDVLASYSNTGGENFSGTFGPEENIWITKDIQTGTPAISSFYDSVVATPEPSSIGLMLMAAFGIAVSARKLRKA
jgi:hypothetical protein